MGRMIGLAVLAIVAAAAMPAAAETVPGPKAAVASSDISAQQRVRPRIRVYPGRLLYRECTFRLVQEWRPSGTVIVPRQRCWWVRG
jgi:hypothetical protein